MALNPNRDGVRNFVARIPKRQLVGLGKILGDFLYYFDWPHRRTVRRNLKFAHPHWSPNQIQRLVRGFFRHFGITILEIFQLAFLTREDVLSQIRVEGIDFLRAALEKQNGVIIASAHQGNWEMSLQGSPCYFQRPITGVAKKLRNAVLDRMIHNLRTRFGNKIIYKKGALPEMRQVLRQGGILGLMMDISRRFDGVEVEFFGHRATATPAAALLALRCRSAIVPIFNHRDGDGTLRICIEPPIQLIRTKDLREDIRINTQLITDRIEQAVRKNPAQWNWTLKRWKEFYPDLYPDSKKRLRQIEKKKQRKGKKKP